MKKGANEDECGDAHSVISVFVFSPARLVGVLLFAVGL